MQLQLGAAPTSNLHADVLKAAEAARQACLDGPRGGFVAPPVRPPRKKGKKARKEQAALWSVHAEEKTEERPPEGPKLTLIQQALRIERKPFVDPPRSMQRCPMASREVVRLDEEGHEIAVRCEWNGANIYFARRLQQGEQAVASVGLGDLPSHEDAIVMVRRAFPEISTQATEWRGCILVTKAAPTRADRSAIETWIQHQEQRVIALRKANKPPRPRAADSPRTRGAIWHRSNALVAAARGVG